MNTQQRQVEARAFARFTRSERLRLAKAWKLNTLEGRRLYRRFYRNMVMPPAPNIRFRVLSREESVI